MSTVNISLPQEQINLSDQLIARYGFANRSEFMRSLIRLVTLKPQLVEHAATFPFTSTPPGQSVRTIISDMRKTKKYSNAFLKDLETGLNQSRYFKP